MLGDTGSPCGRPWHIEPTRTRNVLRSILTCLSRKWSLYLSLFLKQCWWSLKTVDSKNMCRQSIHCASCILTVDVKKILKRFQCISTNMPASGYTYPLRKYKWNFIKAISPRFIHATDIYNLTNTDRSKCSKVHTRIIHKFYIQEILYHTCIQKEFFTARYKKRRKD